MIVGKIKSTNMLILDYLEGRENSQTGGKTGMFSTGHWGGEVILVQEGEKGRIDLKMAEN